MSRRRPSGSITCDGVLTVSPSDEDRGKSLHPRNSPGGNNPTMTLHEVDIAAAAWHPDRLLYVPGHGVLALWIDDESHDRLWGDGAGDASVSS